MHEYVYVASSWRNELQPLVVQALRDAGIDCYDFKNPGEGSVGFSWRETKSHDAPEGIPAKGSDWEDVYEYMNMLNHPRAIEGFANDYNAMSRASHFVMVLPCGKSAHLELGWATAREDKQTCILLENPVEPDLMYRLADVLHTDIDSVVEWVKLTS
jgi:hypothetical protein